MSAPKDLPAKPPAGGVERRRAPTTLVLGFFIGAAALSGLGFGIKIFEFADDLFADQGIGFAGAHLVTYAFVAVGFLLLLAGTFLRGHYADIEKAKYDMLESERMNDRLEFPGTAPRG